MPKPITLEMLHAMSPAQRRTLHANATGMDTPASRAVLELLSQDNLLDAPKAAKASAGRATTSKTGARKKTARVAKASAPLNAKTVIFGRQA